MSRFARAIAEAVTSLRENPKRAAAMVAAVAVAIAVLSATIIAAQGARERVDALVNKHGLDLIMVRAGGDVQVFAPTADRGLASLMPEDARAIAAEVPNVRLISAVQNKRGINVSYQDRSIVTRGFGVEQDWIDIRRWAIAEGEFLDESDLAGTARVAVLGQKVARALFPDGSGVGATIRVNGDPYVVKGVFIEMGVDQGGDDWDHRIVVPFTTASRRLFGRPYLEQIVLRAGDPARAAATAERVRELLRVRHGIRQGVPDDFFVREPQDVEGAAIESSSTIMTLSWATAIAALVAAGIVIMNVMLLAVGQRAREIALRRAVGARTSDIEQMVLAESLLVVDAGALIGIGLGAVAAMVLESSGMASARITWHPFAAAAIASALLGVVFGWRPAKAAAGTQPAMHLKARHV